MKLDDLDMGQLDYMWDFLKLRKENSCTKKDVRDLKEQLDAVRQAMIQKTAGQRKDDKAHRINFYDLGTHINLVVLNAMALYIYGGLDVLENNLPGSMPDHNKDTIETVPIVYGEWVNKRLVDNKYKWSCSKCGETGNSAYHYCPHCGARMDYGTWERKND